MNVMISVEYCADAEKKAVAAEKHMQNIWAIEKDCASFNNAKKDLYDRLSAIIEAFSDNLECDVHSTCEATLWTIMAAKDRLDALFSTVLRVWGGDDWDA